MKIYAFPYAFGGANIYNQIKKDIDPRIKFRAMNYPGHEERFIENLKESIILLAEDAYANIVYELEEDYYLLGYSMGGYVCVELYHLIFNKNIKLPRGIILMSTPEPLKDQKLDDKDLDSIEIIRDILMDNNEINKEILYNCEFMELIAPIVKSDCIAIRNYHKEFNENRVISCPVLLIRGDEEADPTEDLKWNEYLNNMMTYKIVKGNHYFIFNSTSMCEVIRAIEDFIFLNLSAECKGI